ncbi:hypothetical protein ACLI4R_10715 [Natrialbaceae archaeon A-chndr2]
MAQFDVENRVRIDIPDETDLDHDLHGSHGVVTNVIEDDAGASTGDDRDSAIYRVELDSGAVVDLRWRDLRPPFDE